MPSPIEIPDAENIKLVAQQIGSTMFTGLFSLCKNLQSPWVTFIDKEKECQMQEQPEKYIPYTRHLSTTLIFENVEIFIS